MPSLQWVSSPGPRSKVLHLVAPIHTANASARRCTGPAFSQSPARSGHSACMRKIFDESLRPLTLHRHQNVLYPPLPNISRQLRPLGTRDEGNDALPRVHQSQPRAYQPDQDESRVSSRSASRSSSESWSEDLIYLEAERLHASPGLTASPDERVRDWLSATATDSHRDVEAMTRMREDPDMHYNGQVPNDRTVVKCKSVTSDKTDMSINKITACLPHSQRQISGTCRTFDFDQGLATQAHTTVAAFTRSCNATAASACSQATLPQAGTPSRCDTPKLGPLSPNVCTERGP